MAQRAAIVTGGYSGIGLGIARVIGEEGYALTVAARRPEKLEEAVAGLRADGFEVNSVSGNLGDEAVVQEVVRSHRERYGRLDVLINNAGIGLIQSAGARPDESAASVIDINLMGPWRVTGAAMPALRESRDEERERSMHAARV